MTGDPDHLLTSANNPTLAGVKRDWLDPRLREMGLDPDRYELAYELLPTGDGFPRPTESEAYEGVSRMIAEEALLKLAEGLDIPPEILRATPDVNWTTAADPYNIGAFERTRRRFIPRWCYVSGGAPGAATNTARAAGRSGSASGRCCNARRCPGDSRTGCRGVPGRCGRRHALPVARRGAAMNVWTALLIGGAGGLVFGISGIAIIHRSVWGHWRFWERPGR